MKRECIVNLCYGVRWVIIYLYKGMMMILIHVLVFVRMGMWLLLDQRSIMQIRFNLLIYLVEVSNESNFEFFYWFGYTTRGTFAEIWVIVPLWDIIHASMWSLKFVWSMYVNFYIINPSSSLMLCYLGSVDTNRCLPVIGEGLFLYQIYHLILWHRGSIPLVYLLFSLWSILWTVFRDNWNISNDDDGNWKG